MNEDWKIREAEFFLTHMAGATLSLDAFRFYTSAFNGAARSALLYARKEARGKPRGGHWYNTQLAIEPVTAFLRDHRNTDIHHRPLPMRTNARVEIPSGAMTMGSTTAGFAFTELPEGTTTYAYAYKDWKGPEDVLALSRQYLNEIKRIVADGRQRGFLS